MRRWPLRNSKWQFASDGVSVVVVVVDFRQENDEKYFQMTKKKKNSDNKNANQKEKWKMIHSHGCVNSIRYKHANTNNDQCAVI